MELAIARDSLVFLVPFTFLLNHYFFSLFEKGLKIPPKIKLEIFAHILSAPFTQLSKILKGAMHWTDKCQQVKVVALDLEIKICE